MLMHRLGGAIAALGMLLYTSIAGGETPAGPPMNDGMSSGADSTAIRRTLSDYETALNASNVDSVMPLYTEDGVFMPPQSASAVGKTAVRAAYEAVFRAITLHVRFDVVEIVQMAPEWAFVRTNSSGTVTVHATDARSAEANQELFILRKGVDGRWRISRYSFSPTLPAPDK